MHLSDGGLQVEQRDAHEHHDDYVWDKEYTTAVLVDQIRETPETSVADAEPNHSQYIVKVTVVELALVCSLRFLLDLEFLDFVEQMGGMFVHRFLCENYV